ncbi:hypothetical protein DAPPUDRAFT_304149 [Daphnia pulex]|uniref:Uncharacterized protein n=1 Tax=Daphnia pulex TaxID=6669 RepID=E9GJK7_DAPPU|nr:hypothetical protein DAPPUDRAFT_304149 [Daphnia pulex]|eukprot:EFX80479.1 hypothetical protein DAPPUDRAFT_304149 [Daphnia pulex]
MGQQPFAVLFLALCVVVVSFTSAEPGIKQKFPRIPNLLTFFFQGLKEANKTEPSTTAAAANRQRCRRRSWSDCRKERLLRPAAKSRAPPCRRSCPTC